MSTTQSQEFKTAGAFTFNVPAGVSSVKISAAAAGGGGGASVVGGGRGGGAGGGAGESCENIPLNVTPSGTLTGVVGTGGLGSNSTFGADGTGTTVGAWISLQNGFGGNVAGSVNSAGHCRGGGPLAIVNSGNNANTVGSPSVFEPFGFVAGAQGGGPSSNSNATGEPGGACNGQRGGSGGIFILGTDGFNYQGGSGGAATPFAHGGDGSSGSNTTPVKGGNGSKGSGGAGAAAGRLGAGDGGDGGDGYVLVQWESP